MRLLPAGAHAVLVEVESTAQATALYAAARAADVAVADLVPAALTVLFDGVADLGAVHRFLAAVDLSMPAEARLGPIVEVPTTYDGADVVEVARLWQMTTTEVKATHTATEFTVAFCGFAPGFAYCTGLPDSLAVPRLDTPRTRVPAGSVALAGPFTGVYPTASPGGWRLLGRTDLRLWDPAADPPATLAPGTRVRFLEVGR